MVKRVFVYVDGFNLYHAIKDLNEPHLKWVDLWKLSENLVINRKNEIIHEVKYFTAYLKEKEEKYRRHSDYVSALKAKNVTPVIGNFKDKFITCRECNHQYKTVEEKQTDVNIGAHLIADTLLKKFDRALVISADTDLIGAVELAKSHAKNQLIDIVAPPNRRYGREYIQFQISPAKIRDALLPECIQLKNGKTVERPEIYSPPVQNRMESS